MANGLGTWCVALGMWALQVCTNDESGLTLIFFHDKAKFDSLYWKVFEMFVFL